MTIYDILEESQLEWRNTPGQPDEIKICCPLCVERGENPDERFRLGINVRTGLGHCFNCGWSSSDYLFTARELARVGEVELVGTRVTAHERVPRAPKAVKAQEPVFLKGLPSGYERFNWVSSFEAPARTYLMNRGIRRDQIDYWEIGWALTGEYAGRVIIPVVMGEHLAGVVGRDFTGNSTLRYKNSESLRGIFGAKQHDFAVLSEGAMDALRVEPVAAQYKHDSLCVFGSNLSDDQLDFLKRYRKGVILLPDHDKPGCKGARITAEQMSDAGIKVSVAIPNRLDGSDPGSQTNEFLVTRMRGAVAWSRNTERMLRHREAFV